MDFLKFLNTIKDSQFQSDYAVICFRVSKEPPIVFFEALLAALKKNDVYVETVNVAEQEVAQIISRFETSFLGINVFYWLRSSTGLESKKKKELLSYLAHYRGPNTVALVIGEDDVFKSTDKKIIILDVPLAVDKNVYAELVSLVAPQGTSNNTALGVALFKHKQKMSVDAACLLIRYGMLLGSSVDQFLSQWLPQLISPEQSLFIVSQLLFAKDAKAFFHYWTSIKSEYPDIFWTVYFSEQMWRAAQFVEAATKKSDVKALSFRLPFSFIKKDWQKTSVLELSKAHQALYEVDHALKNGHGTYSLDLFCLQFLNGQLNAKS